jgi:hypothetical protein
MDVLLATEEGYTMHMFHTSGLAYDMSFSPSFIERLLRPLSFFLTFLFIASHHLALTGRYELLVDTISDRSPACSVMTIERQLYG